jgi:hypothetical protein
MKTTVSTHPAARVRIPPRPERRTKAEDRAPLNLQGEEEVRRLATGAGFRLSGDSADRELRPWARFYDY